jgi:hypothetical protein
MDDEELCVPDDVLEDASAASYQMLPKHFCIFFYMTRNFSRSATLR